MTTKFILNRGIRSIYSDEVVFSRWYPRSKILDDRILAERQTLEMMSV